MALSARQQCRAVLMVPGGRAAPALTTSRRGYRPPASRTGSCRGAPERSGAALGAARARRGADREGARGTGGAGPGRILWAQPAGGVRDLGRRDRRVDSEDHGNHPVQERGRARRLLDQANA